MLKLVSLPLECSIYFQGAISIVPLFLSIVISLILLNVGGCAVIAYYGQFLYGQVSCSLVPRPHPSHVRRRGGSGVTSPNPWASGSTEVL